MACSRRMSLIIRQFCWANQRSTKRRLRIRQGMPSCVPYLFDSNQLLETAGQTTPVQSLLAQVQRQHGPVVAVHVSPVERQTLPLQLGSGRVDPIQGRHGAIPVPRRADVRYTVGLRSQSSCLFLCRRRRLRSCSSGSLCSVSVICIIREKWPNS